MPYQAGARLTIGERASKLGHLEVVNSPLVRNLVNRFEYPEASAEAIDADGWVPFDASAVRPLPTVLAVDGSIQVVTSDQYPTRSLAFVKTALIRLDRRKLATIDKDMPHPVLMKALMSDSAIQHATVFPLRNAGVPEMSNYHLVRNVIKDSLLLQDNKLTHNALKWLAYRKWDNASQSHSPSFGCPHCYVETEGLPYDADFGNCPNCGEEVFITDMIGFHLEMGEDEAPESLATAYMLVNEFLLLVSYIEHMWSRGNFTKLTDTLLLKDGPLSLRAQYSKLVPNIRDFLQFAQDQGHPVHLVGQEKTGKFVDHLAELHRFVPPHKRGEPSNYAVLSHRYIRQQVDHAPERVNPYGMRTNYGEKVLVKLDPHTSFALSVPTGTYNDALDFPQSSEEFIGLDRVMATLPSLVSHQNENALVPIALAHGVASLSSYPSAAVLKLFAGI